MITGRLEAIDANTQQTSGGILAYYPHRIISAAIEAINSIIYTSRHRAKGLRNFRNLRAICY